MSDRRSPRRRAVAGSSLLEVLVSLVIVAVGLLGLIGMQARATGSQKDSFDRKAAAELLSQIGERMRANHLGFMGSAYASTLLPGTAPAAAPGCIATAPCTPATVAAMDLATWHLAMRDRLPDSGAVITPAGGPGAALGAGAASMRVTLAWREARPTTGAVEECTAIGIGDPGYRCLSAEVFP